MKETANTMLDKMCALTFTRHAYLSKEEFLKTIKREGYESEEQAVNDSELGILCGIMKEILMANMTIENLLKQAQLIYGGENE